MAKVSVNLGVTLKLGQGDSYQFVRGDISIAEIDPEEDVDAQLALSAYALDKVWAEASNQVSDKIVANMAHFNPDVETLVATKLNAMKKALDSVISDVNALKKLAKTEA